jgi:hypothetical protein
MTAVRSEAQRAASRINGARSKGPRTEAGKFESRRNGMKHGMAGKAQVLPKDMEAEVVAELETFARQLKPRNPYEQRLVETAALAQVRINRLNRAAEVRLNAHVRHSLRAWDEARAAEVDELTELLAVDPAAAVASLRRLTEGCDRLADRWQDLAESLEQFGVWDDEEGMLFLNLIGHTTPPPADRRPDLYRVWRHAYALRVHADPAAMAAKRQTTPEALLANLPTKEKALHVVSHFVARQIAELETRAAMLYEEFDKLDRDTSPDASLLDTTPDTRLLHRYLAEAHRIRRRALAELETLRAEEEKARREPKASRSPSAPPPPPPPARSEPEPTASRPVVAAPEPPPARSEPEPTASEPAATAASGPNRAAADAPPPPA